MIINMSDTFQNVQFFFFHECNAVGNVGAQPQGGMVGHGGRGGGGHYNTGLPLASRPPNAPGFVPMGQVRPDKGSNNSRYNPIGMGGGYNVYNWN